MTGRLRAALSTATSTPWTRAPTLLLRRPGVLATVFAASAVTAASIASVPLFVSSVGTESVAVQADERCPRDTGATRPFVATPDRLAPDPSDPFQGIGGLEPGSTWVRADELTLTGTAEPIDVRVITREGATDHIRLLEGTAEEGLLLTDRAAAETGLGVGDVATLQSPSAATVRLEVAGIYADLARPTVDDYWCSQAEQLLPEQRGFDIVLPPPLLLVDATAMSGLMSDLRIAEAAGAAESYLRNDQTIGDVDRAIDQLACVTATTPALEWCSDDVPDPAVVGDAADPDDEPDEFVEQFFQTHLPFVAARGRAIQQTVAGGVWPLSALATVAGIGLTAAAASLWIDRRQRELRLLATRGVSPAGLAGKAVLEVSLPMLLGALVGTAFAAAMVVLFGPASALDAGAYRGAVVAGAIAAAVGFATFAVVVGARSRASEVRRSRRSHLGMIPWEIGLIVLTVVAYRRLEKWGVPVGSGARVTEVDAWGLMFPVLFLITVVAVVSRVLAIGARPLRSLSSRWPIAGYVGAHRISRYKIAVLGLLAASAVATGVIGYSTTFDKSLEETLRAKTLTYVGSDTAVRVLYGETMPTIPMPSTVVGLQRDAWIDVGGEETNVRVLAIDPETFASAAFWDPTYSSDSLETIVERLAETRDDGSIPVVIVDAVAEGPTEAAIIEQKEFPVTLEPIAQVTAFPGMNRVEPTVIVDSAALDAMGVRPDQFELWVRGDNDDALAALDATGVRYAITRGADEIADRAAFLTVSWTFGFMQAMGWAAGVLVVAGVAVYLDARRRARVLGYSFVRRMGLTRTQHRRALFIEIAASVVVGCWLGLATSLVGASLALDLVDPVPSYAPPTLWRVVVPTVVGLAIAAVVLTAVAAVLAQRRTDRDNPLEVLRGGL